MTLYIFIGAVFLMLAAALLVAWPLMSQLEPYRESAPTGASFSEADALLDALSELEIDRSTNKIGPQDYAALKAEYQRGYLALTQGQPAPKAAKQEPPAPKAAAAQAAASKAAPKPAGKKETAAKKTTANKAAPKAARSKDGKRAK